MTDNEIIKAMECCYGGGKCEDCPLNGLKNCGFEEKVLDLVNRQKAEITQLQKRIVFWREDMDYRPDEIKSEAIQDFAEKLKSTITINNTNDGYLDYAIDYNCLMEDIDNLVKEVTEGKENA